MESKKDTTDYLEKSLELRKEVLALEKQLEDAEDNFIRMEAIKDAEIQALKGFVRFLTRKWDKS